MLAAAEGQSDNVIAQQLEVNRKTVMLWRTRFTQEGLDSLWEVAPGRGRKPTYGPEKIQAIVDATLRSKPKGMSQWSCRLMAARQGVSKSTINNIWQSHNLKPHRVKSFKLSRDAKFLEKLTDVVGLYLNPPQQAIVLCVDEKSQIQALDRTQPGLPMKKGRCGTMTHDYKRNGTTSLFAALEVLQGRVIGQCYERHRHQEFLQFLRRLDQEFPGRGTLASGDGQLRYAQAAQGPGLAEAPPSLCVTLRAHQFQLAESGRALVWRINQQANPSWFLPQRGEPRESHHRVHGRLERESETFCLDRHRRIDRAEAIALSTNLGTDSARLYPTPTAKSEILSWPVIYRTLH